MEFLMYKIFKHFVCCPFSVIRFYTTDNRSQPEFFVHIFMDGQGTQADALAFQIDFYSSITIDTAVFIVDRLNLLLYLLFWGIGIRLPLFQEVVICIRSDAYTTQKPSYSKYFVIFLNEPISL